MSVLVSFAIVCFLASPVYAETPNLVGEWGGGSTEVSYIDVTDPNAEPGFGAVGSSSMIVITVQSGRLFAGYDMTGGKLLGSIEKDNTVSFQTCGGGLSGSMKTIYTGRLSVTAHKMVIKGTAHSLEEVGLTGGPAMSTAQFEIRKEK